MSSWLPFAFKIRYICADGYLRKYEPNVSEGCRFPNSRPFFIQ